MKYKKLQKDVCKNKCLFTLSNIYKTYKLFVPTNGLILPVSVCQSLNKRLGLRPTIGPTFSSILALNYTSAARVKYLCSSIHKVEARIRFYCNDIYTKHLSCCIFSGFAEWYAPTNGSLDSSPSSGHALHISTISMARIYRGHFVHSGSQGFRSSNQRSSAQI